MTQQALSSDKVANPTNSQAERVDLSEEETKHFLTPFAFKMDKSLFGLPLASPGKRGIALLIDLALIALLSDISAGVLALAIAITLYRLGNKKRAQTRGKVNGYKRRAAMRFVAAFMVFIVLLDTLPPLFEQLGITTSSSDISVAGTPLSLGQSVTLAGYAISAVAAIAESDCKSLTCWQEELDSVAKTAASISLEGGFDISTEQLNDIFVDASESTKLPRAEQDQLVASMHKAYQVQLLALTSDSTVKKANLSTPKLPKIPDEGDVLLKKDKVLVLNDNGQLTDLEAFTEAEKQKKPIYSIIEWVKGIINDLGLGFGWATFYFTAFIALGHGQTLGKKLLGIKVLQLDGTPLSLWDSFGRYGGYGAGLATGLLGFIQVYWDPNRQAIHDKISATVVIDIRKNSLYE